jgi:hypothetical protein
MIHEMANEWAISGLPNMKVNCTNLIRLIKYRNLLPVELYISDIARKELESIDIDGIRYTIADMKYPIIVAEGMENPYNLPFRLIDGRHRILKHLYLNKKTVHSYVLTKNDILSFAELM